MNGYRLSELVEDPVAVERSLARLAKVLVDAQAHVIQRGPPDLADHLADLTRRLRADGDAIDDAFDHAFREVTSAAADACTEAVRRSGISSPEDGEARMYQVLT
ncbi:hypothetical protein GCM10023195_63700 [Actinoallomurus liliacearum]|uniref:Uncharacterized protein n=1 Tax=Actinoallomurus liliacearum TaxID=1080073 RepID=A0ABP8TTS7_9ACTN